MNAAYDGLLKYLESTRPNLRACLTPENFSSLLISPHRVFLKRETFDQILNFIEGIERIREMPAFASAVLADQPCELPAALHFGLFMSYDFHITAEGPKLIEINTNASGSSAIQLLREWSKVKAESALPPDFFLDVKGAVEEEFVLSKVGRTLRTIAIVDERPEDQRAYYEFLIYQALFEEWGYKCVIASVEELEFKDGQLSFKGDTIDFVYNRSTDFYLIAPQSAALRAAYFANAACVSPHPREYHFLADKRRLVDLGSEAFLTSLGVNASTQEGIRIVIPKTLEVSKFTADEIWAMRKDFFFKPKNSFGAKAVYKGASITKKVLAQIHEGDYLAQEVAEPGQIHTPDGEFKYDLRFYVYRNRVQVAGARIFQGQLLNLRTPGGGFGVLEIT